MQFDTKLFVRRQAGGMFQVLDSSAHPGNVWYVDSTNTTNGSDVAGKGVNPDYPFLTLDYAVGRASAGDQILLMPGHNEGGAAVIADIDQQVEIIGLGEGTRRPRFDYDNAAATIDIGAHNVTIRNVTFLASAATILKAIDVETTFTHFTLEDCEFLEAETAGDEFAQTVVLTSGNDDSVIRGNEFRTELAAGACTDAINTAAACDRVHITDNIFKGNWSTAAILGTAADPGIYIARNTIKVKDGEPGIELHGDTVGQIVDNNIASTGLGHNAMIVAAKCEWFNNYGVNADGATAELIGGGEGGDEEEVTGGGSIFYVDSVGGSATNGGTSWSDALDTLNAAVDLCTLNLGDVIHLASKHAETVGGAAAIDLDVAGVTIIGHGSGGAMPTFTFDTNTDTIEINAADVTIENVQFLSAVADLAVALDITGNGDGASIRNCLFADGGANLEMLVAIGVAADTDRLIIEDNRFYTTAGEDCTDGVLFAGASVGALIRRNIFMGDWASACVDHSAGKATDAVIYENKCNNIDAVVGLCINMEATSTGILVDNPCHGGLTGVDPIVAPAMMRSGNVGTQTEGIEAADKYGNRCERASGVTGQTATLAIFTIAGGRAIIHGIVGEVDTANIGAGANAMSVQINPTAGSTNLLCATLDINGDVIGTTYGVLGDPALALVEHGCMSSNGLVLVPGVIQTENAASTAGQIQWTCYWEPFDAGATVVAA